VGTVQLNTIEPCSLAAHGSGNAVFDEPFDFLDGHGF
jgi:hypothetical protein